MKKIILMALCLSVSQFSFAQQSSASTSETEEYLEVRFLPKKGISYRLAPNVQFERAGLFNKNLKPYLKGDEESLKYYKRYNRSFLGIGAGGAIYGLGSASAFLGIIYNDPGTVRAGGIGAVVGLGLMLWANQRGLSSLFKSVDAYNQTHNNKLQNADYFEIAPHYITTWQFRTKPSEDYQNPGLFGSKLKPYFEKDEAAYDAYKTYRMGHIGYTTGNVVGLVGTGMMLSGVISDNETLARRGFLATAGGLICTIVSRNVMTNNIYKAADLINYQRSPMLNSSLMPSIQSSSHSAGLSLVWNIE